MKKDTVDVIKMMQNSVRGHHRTLKTVHGNITTMSFQHDGKNFDQGALISYDRFTGLYSGLLQLDGKIYQIEETTLHQQESKKLWDEMVATSIIYHEKAKPLFTPTTYTRTNPTIEVGDPSNSSALDVTKWCGGLIAVDAKVKNRPYVKEYHVAITVPTLNGNQKLFGTIYARSNESTPYTPYKDWTKTTGWISAEQMQEELEEAALDSAIKITEGFDSVVIKEDGKFSTISKIDLARYYRENPAN